MTRKRISKIIGLLLTSVIILLLAINTFKAYTIFVKVKFLRENKELVGKDIYDSLFQYFQINFENPRDINEYFCFLKSINSNSINFFDEIGCDNINLIQTEDSIFIYWYGPDNTDNQCLDNQINLNENFSQLYFSSGDYIIGGSQLFSFCDLELSSQMFLINNEWQENQIFAEEMNNLLREHLSPLFYDTIPSVEDKRKKVIYSVDLTDTTFIEIHKCDKIEDCTKFDLINFEIINCLNSFNYRTTKKYLLPFAFYESLIKPADFCN